VEVGKRDIVGAVEIWIFSSDMNHDEGKGNAQMLTRLMSRIMHPCIRLGYGLEFGIPVMITEGEHCPSERFHKLIYWFLKRLRRLQFIDWMQPVWSRIHCSPLILHPNIHQALQACTRSALYRKF